MEDWKENTNGFSLVELIVAIAIITVVTSLGIFGLIRFRQTTLVKQASRELFTNIEDARNKALNNTLSSAKLAGGAAPLEAKIDAFAIVVGEENYSLLYCNQSSSTNPEEVPYNCGIERENLKLQTFNEVIVKIDENTPDMCTGILFETVTGDLKIFESADQVIAVDGVCDISVGFGSTGIKEVLKIDAVSNQFGYIDQ